MTQEIIVFIILAAVTVYIIFSYIRKLRTKKESPCGGCTGCDLKKDLSEQSVLCGHSADKRAKSDTLNQTPD